MADLQNSSAADGTNNTGGATGDGAPVKEYRSLVLTGFGGIRNVKVEKKPEFLPKEGEVLIRVKICGMNFNDLMMRQGALENTPKPPFVMGFECSGQIEAIGENVQGLAVGDDVVAITDHSSWAEIVATPANFVYKLPIGMSHQDAASLLVNYLTAYLLMFDVGCLKSGQSVLVHSAGGGVGHAVSQLSQTLDNVTLYGTASTEKHECIKNKFTHLYDHVVDYSQEIKKDSPDGIDLVLDSLCGEDTKKGITLLKPMGRYILYGNSSVVTGDTKSFLSFAKSWWQVDKISPNDLYTDNKIVSGFNLRQLLFRQGQHDYIRSVVQRLFRLYSEGRIRPCIDSTWALEDVCEAMQKMHDRKNVGKILLDPNMDPKPKPEPTTSKPFNFSLSSIQNHIATSVTNKLNFSQSTDKEPVLEAKSEEDEELAPTQ